MGDDAMKIYQGMQFDTPEMERTVEDILQALEEYSIGILNKTYEIFAFRQRKQGEGEAFDKFYNNLRVLSKTCNFCIRCSDSLLWDQFVEGVCDQFTKQELLKIQHLTLQKSVDICRAAEMASTHSPEMGLDIAQVMRVHETSQMKEKRMPILRLHIRAKAQQMPSPWQTVPCMQ